MSTHDGEAIPPVTRRQAEVWQLIAMGHPIKRVAFTLGLTYSTASRHREQLMLITGVHCIADLTRLAVKYGIVEVPVVLAPGELLRVLPVNPISKIRPAP